MSMLIPSGEKIIEVRTCRSCRAKFAITDRDLEFYDRVSPVFAGRKELLPVPTACPDCRAQAVLSTRNERNLYRTKCAATGKDITSIHSPDKKFPVYDQKYWWSDAWNPLDYGREYDFSRPFFEQFAELYASVPKISLNAPKSQNSEYTNQCQGNKDCYLCFCVGDSENCYFGMWNQDCRSCADCLYVEYCEHCYEVTNAIRCHGCRYSANLEDCRDVHFCQDLIACHDCIGCHNLVNREYCIFNEQHTKEDYAKRSTELLSGGYPGLETLRERSRAAAGGIPRKFYNGKHNEGSSGDYLQNNKNAHVAYNCRDNESTKYCRDSWRVTQGIDLVETLGMECCLCVEGTAFSSYSHFSMKLSTASFVLYSSHCNSVSHLFGCVGLKNLQYCILNKQYTEDEYNALVPRIIEHMRRTGEWGEFFAPSLSAFGYDESVAMEYYPLSREEAIARGFHWSEYVAPAPKADKVIPAAKLPPRISDVPDDILAWAIECEATGRPYKIIRQELEFYRKHDLPIPRRHPDRRHLDRMERRNPRKLHERKCDNCSKLIVTTYAPDRPERVYCEECYEREIYG